MQQDFPIPQSFRHDKSGGGFIYNAARCFPHNKNNFTKNDKIFENGVFLSKKQFQFDEKMV